MAQMSHGSNEPWSASRMPCREEYRQIEDIYMIYDTWWYMPILLGHISPTVSWSQYILAVVVDSPDTNFTLFDKDFLSRRETHGSQWSKKTTFFLALVCENHRRVHRFSNSLWASAYGKASGCLELCTGFHPNFVMENPNFWQTSSDIRP